VEQEVGGAKFQLFSSKDSRNAFLSEGVIRSNFIRPTSVFDVRL